MTMEKIAVIYWTGTGNTRTMAESIAEGINSAGAAAELFNVSEITPDKTMNFDKLVFGCPSMGAENLEESEFEPFFSKLEASLGGRKVALFGSYGWGDGQWMRDWSSRTTSTGARLFEEGLMAHETPDSESIATCHNFGARFATF